jgi:hypothetical protein
MSLPRAAGLLVVALMSATAVTADVKGVPSFSAEEIELIKRDARLIIATRSCPWRLRHALDVWENLRLAAHPPHVPAEAVQCSPPQEEERGDRASVEGPFDLLQILKEAAGQGTKR